MRANWLYFNYLIIVVYLASDVMSSGQQNTSGGESAGLTTCGLPCTSLHVLRTYAQHIRIDTRYYFI